MTDAKAEAEAAAAARRRAAQERAAAFERQRHIPPHELFRTQTDRFSAWDAQGVPTHDMHGQLLSATQRKKLAKEVARQAQLYSAAGHAAQAMPAVISEPPLPERHKR